MENGTGSGIKNGNRIRIDSTPEIKIKSSAGIEIEAKASYYTAARRAVAGGAETKSVLSAVISRRPDRPGAYVPDKSYKTDVELINYLEAELLPGGIRVLGPN
ncbi:hypothetical protein EVAR_54338_1 [Eumeta japonica]|uniref:Uncharacterized protein n=1 Tax=Eumeta variegata TaxID=151549 RepID=A0A4C1Y7E9_EUMVA|nr:hypothetical protein EVAR_54338_1 [Eumeta japonica]